MSAIGLFNLPADCMVFVHAPTAKPTKPLLIPEGVEAVVIHNNVLSDPYRPGDQIPVHILSQLGEKGSSGNLFFCRKYLQQPILWGCGDLPLQDGYILGASGLACLYTTNARLLVRHFVLGEQQLDEKRIHQRLKISLIAIIRQHLQEIGLLSEYQACLHAPVLSQQLSERLRLPLLQMGLGLSEISVKEIILHQQREVTP